MKVIVGLGNPGLKYSGTRHNVGFMVADRLAREWQIGRKSSLCHTWVGEGRMFAQVVRLVWPQTSMNLSGESVQALLRRWRLTPSGLLVVCDDVSLPMGTIRLRGQGSDGGHRGLASICEAVGTPQIPRLRVGILQTGRNMEDLTAYVLGRFKKDESPLLHQGLTLAMKACEVWVKDGLTKAMNHFNQRKG